MRGNALLHAPFGAVRVVAAALIGLIGLVAVGIVASFAAADSSDRRTSVKGTLWVANRGTHTIQAFDASTGAVVTTVPMRAGSQPGDLAYARGKLYVAEEFGTPPAIAILDARTGADVKRIELAAGSRPHHVHTSRRGRLVAVGLYGTDTVAVVDARRDELVGIWDINPLTTNGRVHAGVFSPNGKILYLTSDASNEVVAIGPRTGEILWRISVGGAHELAVTRDGKTAYVTRRTANRMCVLDLETHSACEDRLTLGLPDTLQLARGDTLLTITLRTMPAQMAVIDTRTFDYELVRLGSPLEPTTLAAHQWTSPNGRYTFAAYEGGSSPGVAVLEHRVGNRIVATLSYPGRPHGLDLARGGNDD